MIYLNVVIVMLTWYWLVHFDYTGRKWTHIFDGIIFSWNLAEVLLYIDKAL
jgi:hypothetical protein